MILKSKNLWIEAFGSVDSDHNLDALSFGVKGTSLTSSPPMSRNRKFCFDNDMMIFIASVPILAPVDHGPCQAVTLWLEMIHVLV